MVGRCFYSLSLELSCDSKPFYYCRIYINFIKVEYTIDSFFSFSLLNLLELGGAS